MARIKVFDKKSQSWVYADKSFGKDGIIPVKGVDYFTDADKQEIAELASELVDVSGSGGNVDLTGYATEQFVRDGFQPKGEYLTQHQDISGKVNKNGLTLGVYTDGLIYVFVDGQPVGNGVELPTGGIDGYVDSDKNIVIRGLPDGSYSVRYEMEDGSLVNIGNLVLEEVLPMINWIKEVGYVSDKRISLSEGIEKDATGYYSTGFIPCKYGQTVRIKNIDVTDNNNIVITSFDADKNPIYGTTTRCGTTLYHAFVEKGTESNGVYAAIVNTAMYACFTSNVAYIRIASKSITDESIITVDQEIV